MDVLQIQQDSNTSVMNKFWEEWEEAAETFIVESIMREGINKTFTSPALTNPTTPAILSAVGNRLSLPIGSFARHLEEHKVQEFACVARKAPRESPLRRAFLYILKVKSTANGG